MQHTLKYICTVLLLVIFVKYGDGVTATRSIFIDNKEYFIIKGYQGDEIICSDNECEECCYSRCSCICLSDKCSFPPKNPMALFTAAQIAMTGALIVGILTLVILFWKICTSTVRRPRTRRRNVRGGRDSAGSGVSLDSIQQIVIERLRDAPPSYTRATSLPMGDTPPPYNAIGNGHVNAAFELDVPPPSYNTIVEERESSEVQQTNDNESAKTDVNSTSQVPKNENNTPDSTLYI